MEKLSEMPVTRLSGVGASRAEALSRLGVTRVSDLISLYPRSYENRGDVRLLRDSENGEKHSFLLTVATAPKKALIRKGMSILKFRAYDESGTAEITYFNQDFLAGKFELGRTFRFYGKPERKKTPSGKDLFSLSSPVAEDAENGAEKLSALVPVYPLTHGLTQNLISKLISQTMSLYSVASEESADIIPTDILIKNGLATRSFALKNIHAPQSFADLAAAKKRLIFEEFFLFALGIALSSKRTKSRGAPVCSEGDISELLALLPYSLTGAQSRVIDEIRADMAKDVPMTRLLVGDVGCGKTVCAAAAMLIAVRSGKQAALMVPTEILAHQHYEDLFPIFEKMGIKAALLTGSTSAAEKRRIYAGMSDKGERIDIVIGTHALISGGVEFADLGLVITDEQHRFGVKQRTALGEKGEHVHMLVMSATPIPRSLAFTLYGDLDISKIDEMPKGRERVDTFVVDEKYRERLDAFIMKLTGEGGQVYAVCPAIEDKDDEDGDIDIRDIDEYGAQKSAEAPLKSAVRYAEELSARMPERRVALVHGRMKTDEKDAIMNAFSEGKIDVLVSTTVIEVGVNVPNACLMIVENAERFGLSQLHQLRGRVGRGSRKSYCVLVSDSDGERARQRLETMKTMYDGFAIAEKDLAMRGPGDFTPHSSGEVRQSGSMRFRIADMCTDSELFFGAFDAAKQLLEQSPTLSDSPALRAAVDDLFEMTILA